MWRVLGSPPEMHLVELGPGRGLFAQDVLDWSQKKFPDFFRALRYLQVEVSPALRKRLAQTLAAHTRSGRARICSAIEALPNPLGVPAIIFANEFFDALPVEVISHRGELRIGSGTGGLVETFVPPSADALEYLDRYSVHPEAGERVEAALQAQNELRAITRRLGAGFAIVIDYGYTREEQLAGRHRGTVTAFRRHSISANPYEAPGEQDITAHVNFTALQAAARESGLEPLALLTQAQFLMGIGESTQFADAFAEARLPQERAKVALQLKHLVTPAGMGENFHVLVMSKGIDARVASQLSGLRFAR
jgi:SAM-dependent MidA family methyltransferase